MDIIKIQQNVIKDILKGKTKEWFIDKNKDATQYYLTNKYCIYIIDAYNFILDFNKIEKINNVEKFLKYNNCDYTTATPTNNIKRYEKINCIELINENNKLTYIDENKIKYFDKDISFKSFNEKSIVYIFENDYLAGAILPVKIKE